MTIPMLMPRDETPDIPLSQKSGEAKWVPKVGEEIEVASSQTAERLQRKFICMQGDKYVVRSQSFPGGVMVFRCAWPINLMSGPDMTPKVEASPVIFLAESAAHAPVSASASVSSATSTPVSASELAAADPDGWIPWSGGECPVPNGTYVHARYRGGREAIDKASNDSASSSDAGPAFWKHDNMNSDIIAYRVCK